MDNIELQNIWKTYDHKIEQLIVINKDIAVNLSKQQLNQQIGKLYRPKWIAIFIGIPYTLLLIVVTTIASMAKAYFVAIGFGTIALIMTLLLLHYCYQLYLISQVRNNEEVLPTQQQLSKLRISSFKSLRLSVFQLPFWSICWVSVDALKESPFIYGGVNLLVFSLLTYIAYWLYDQLSYKHEKSKIRDFFLSGREWEPILKSAEILEQIKEYQK